MPNKRVHCWTLHLFVVWCVRKYEKDRTGDQQLACSWTPNERIVSERERDIQTGVLLAYIAAHYLFIVASDCSSRFSKKLKYRDRQIGHLWILFAYSSFLSFVPYSLGWLTCRFHHRNCLHSLFVVVLL